MSVWAYQSRLNRWATVAILLAGVWLSGCQSPQNSQTDNDDKPNVVSTSTMIADWTEQIAEDTVDLTGILNPGDDPHIYEPVPADSRALETADLILYNGYNLEPNLIRMMNSIGGKARKVAVGEVVTPLELEKEQQGKVPDPHVWGSVQNTIQMVERLRDELIQLAPEHRERFTKNAEQYIQELRQLDRWITEQIQTIPASQRRLITTHDAFQYYAKTYGLEVVGTLIGISTEEQPSAQTVSQLAESIKKLGVPTIFAETTINPRLISTVAEEAKVKLAETQLYSDSIGAPGSAGDTYIKMMVSNTKAIVENLGGKYTEFQPEQKS
ncbi:MAG TPA: zinc ABC transporter substrate-binding protein [Leptolyngbyaceae cyanobacterium M33_DOE_097]|uniref:Metal ABC transporter substrate-binding protein n=1 Tax=Oscillatoriales cyanobacterium SpSt-418 TaxID=2282169 RepID=A0A7C3KCY1_9CYAN|nr:zinc ABC transporter substrate-binding protein [Leptolyngbyaceae cyanobacterium M33_DOE_097]